jgi:fatty acid desaturase
MDSTTQTAPRRDAYLPMRRTLLPASRVRELSKARPGRVIRDTAVQWAIIVAAWAAGAAIGTWWAAVLAAIVVGNRYYALFIIGHDGLHRRLFQSTAANDRFNDTLILGPITAVTRINNRNHLKHHQNLATEDDPDRHRHGCFNKGSRVALLGYLTGISSVIVSVANVFLHDRTEIGRRVKDEGRPPYRVRDFVVIIGWQIGLFLLLNWLYGWWGLLLMWWVPVFLFAFLGDNLRSFLEHSQIESDADADEHRLVSYDSVPIERALVAPMHMNHHAAHHLWPSIPYFNLPIADAEMRQAAGAESVTWRRSYFAHLWRYARALPVEGCEPARAAARVA